MRAPNSMFGIISICYKIFYDRFSVIRVYFKSNREGVNLTLPRVNDTVECSVESPLSDHPKRKDQKHVWV